VGSGAFWIAYGQGVYLNIAGVDYVKCRDSSNKRLGGRWPAFFEAHQTLICQPQSRFQSNNVSWPLLVYFIVVGENRHLHHRFRRAVGRICKQWQKKCKPAGDQTDVKSQWNQMCIHVNLLQFHRGSFTLNAARVLWSYGELSAHLHAHFKRPFFIARMS
jgi:hypothetical protein